MKKISAPPNSALKAPRSLVNVRPSTAPRNLRPREGLPELHEPSVAISKKTLVMTIFPKTPSDLFLGVNNRGTVVLSSRPTPGDRVVTKSAAGGKNIFDFNYEDMSSPPPPRFWERFWKRFSWKVHGRSSSSSASLGIVDISKHCPGLSVTFRNRSFKSSFSAAAERCMFFLPIY